MASKLNSIERKQEIMKLLSTRESLDVEELATLFGVSKVTVRTDLDAMAERGLLVRTHGGAMSPEKQNLIRLISKTSSEYKDEKEKIAKAASQLIGNGDAIILDNGSTTLHLAKYLSQKNLTVATGSIPVIQELMNDNTIDLLIIGGTVRRYSLGAIGPLAKACLGLLKTNWLFMGASALSVEEGVLCTNLIEAETKQFMIKSADKVCLMADSKKMGASSFGKVCGWDQVDYFITDGIDDEARKTIEEQGVTVIIAQ